MSDLARQNILSRIRNKQSVPTVVDLPPVVPKKEDVATRVQQLKEMMEAVRTEVHMSVQKDLVSKVVEIAEEKHIKNLVYDPESKLGRLLQKNWPQKSKTHFVPFKKDIEDFKEELFQVDAGITSSYGGIAETGTVVLWPTMEEPRLMSLIPPIHIAILEREQIFHNLREMMLANSWNKEMPTNILLISGPSKTRGYDQIMIKQDHLKYQWYGDDAPEVLFDLKKDPGETTNVMTDPLYEDHAKRFRTRLAELGWGPDADPEYVNAGYYK